MAQKLEDLEVDEVSLVDHPANSEVINGRKIPRATIALWKRDSTALNKAKPGEGSNELSHVHKTKEGDTMPYTLEQIEKKLTDQDAELAVLKAGNAALEAENEMVLKMSSGERELYATMPVETRKKFTASDEEKRKKMMADAKCAKHEADLVASMAPEVRKQYELGGPEVRKALLADVEKTVAKSLKKKMPPQLAAAQEGASEDGEGDDVAEEEETPKEKAAKADMALKIAKTEDRLARSEAELAAIRKRGQLEHFVNIAKNALPNTTGTDEEKAEKLMKVAEATGGEDSDVFKSYFEDLRQADKVMAVHYGEVGKTGGPVPAEKVWDAKVKEIQKRDSVSVSKATDKAMDEAPELFLAYEKQHRQYANAQ